VFWRSDSDHLCGMVPGAQVRSRRPNPSPLQLSTRTAHPQNVLRSLDTAGVRARFGDAIPGWMAAQLGEQLGDQATNGFGSVIKCSQLHAGSAVLLLGDAAHAVTSSFGQGCNMALESVEVRLVGMGTCSAA